VFSVPEAGPREWAFTMKTNRIGWRNRAVTRFELLVVVGVLALLTTVVLPGVANTNYRYGRLACLNNLRQIGVAFHAWGNDHGDFLPLRTSWKYGGLGKAPPGELAPYRAVYAWYNFAFLSNQLVSPRILTCPSDAVNVPYQVSTWSALWVYQSWSVSYGISPEATPSKPQAIVSTDRNIQASGLGNCSAGLTGIWSANFSPQNGVDPKVMWTNALHYPMGNVLLNDGRVVETTTAGLRSYLGSPENSTDANGTFHLVIPYY